MTASTAVQTTTALAPTAPAQIASANEMATALKAVQSAIAPDLNAHELHLFAMVAFRSGLDPFARQIFAVKRDGKVTFQTGIDGFRSTAERTGSYDGQDEPEYGPACSCKDAPSPHPEWARVTVYRVRNGERRPQSATAFWHEFKPAPGKSGNADSMWKKMPRNQLAKCAEALAIRKAFPYVLADVYSTDEMAQANTGPVVVEHRPTARQAVAERAAALDEAQIPQDVDEAAGEPMDDVVEGDAVEVSAGLTKDALLEALAELNVDRDYASQTARRLFPDANGQLTDAQRGELVEALRAEVAGL